MLKLFDLIKNFLPNALAFFVGQLATKKAVGIASTVAYVALTVAFISCLKGAINAIFPSAAIPPFVTHSLGIILPNNFIQVTSAIISAMVCRAGYDLGTEKIKLLNSAN